MTRFWCVVPAAGSSLRMGAVAAPKQYLPLAGRSVIEWSLAPLLDHHDCQNVVVVLAPDDRHWPDVPIAWHPKIIRAVGGVQRSDSVHAGLAALASRAGENDWVLVHDAARPCLTAEDLRRLLQELRDDAVGGLLAAPVVDTLKLADEHLRVRETVPRAALWRALTPQMFRYGILQRALAQSRESVTDEAQAVEALGLQPRLVAGDADNLKITVVDDLLRAERILKSRSSS